MIEFFIVNAKIIFYTEKLLKEYLPCQAWTMTHRVLKSLKILDEFEKKFFNYKKC